MYYYVLYAILAFILSFVPAYLVFPRFIQKMKKQKPQTSASALV